MKISRIQIEEGFLNGFDLKPSPGLTVLIGARGTGKTSVIELIRFALGARSHTADSQIRSLEHAKAVLGGGAVTVTLSDEFEEVTVTRGADDAHPQTTGEFTSPIVLSQTEIETIGLSEAGRLNLIDGFVSQRAKSKSEEAAAIGAIRTVYKEINSLESEIAGFDESVKKSEELNQQLVELQAQQAVFQANSDAAAAKQHSLAALSTQTSHFSVVEEVLERFEGNANDWANRLEELLLDDFGPEGWEDQAEEDPLHDMRFKYFQNIESIAKIAVDFGQLQAAAEVKKKAITAKRIEVEKKARVLRADLEKLAEGSGAVARQISSVLNQIAQLKSRSQLLAERMTRLKALRFRRNDLIDRLEQIRSLRSDARAKVAKAISCALAPHIRIDIQRSAQYTEYRSSITEALRGSGMKYGDLAAAVVERVSPRELMDFAESGDFLALGELLSIPKDRAARLIGHLRDVGMQDIVTSDIEDNVRMTLLDGVEYKDVTSLSAGQRCTVVLSVVLQHSEKTLVIDQPEDHLDNAFIATTVIKALRERNGDGQVILSTHNANIPVLGDADLIVELTSDGRNGFIEVCEPLHHPKAVSAISNVMEGGRKAFRKRFEFYEANDPL